MAFPDMTSLTPPIQKLKTKDAQNRKRSTLDDNTTTREPSFGSILPHNFQIVKLHRQNLHYRKRKVCV